MSFMIVFLRSLFFYFFFFLIYRIMGKREVGQLGIIDLIVSILIAELAVISIENYDKSLWYSLIPIITLSAIQIILAFISLKTPKFRNFLDGKPSVIINNGKINYKEMIKQKYNLDDLLVQIREKGNKSIEEVEYAILENNGTLSVFPKEKEESSFPLAIILDGMIQDEVLISINKDRKWLYSILNKKNIEVSDIFYAFYKNKNIFIIKNDDLL